MSNPRFRDRVLGKYGKSVDSIAVTSSIHVVGVCARPPMSTGDVWFRVE